MCERTFGIEIEHYYPEGVAGCTAMLKREGLGPWTKNIHADGSGVEICSPVLKGKDGLEELSHVFSLLKRDGGRCTTRDGMHIHQGAPDFVGNKEAIVRLVKSWHLNQNLIDAFVDVSRHANGACQKWAEAHITQLEAAGWDGTSTAYYGSGPSNYYPGRRALNIAALSEHGTVEFRQHHGTLEFDEAQAWILFGHRFMDSVAERKNPFTCTDALDLLKRVRAPKAAEEVLAAKATGERKVAVPPFSRPTTTTRNLANISFQIPWE